MAKKELAIVAATEFLGGAELYVSRLAQYLGASGVPVVLLGALGTWPKDLPRVDLGLGPKWGTRSLPRGMLRAMSELRAFKQRAEQHRGATFNFHFKREQVLFTAVARREGRVVWTEHGTYPAGVFGAVLAPFYRRASLSADAIVCVSEFVADSIRPKVADQSKVVVIDSAVDSNKFTPASRPASDNPMALVIGRLEPTKRPGLAIQGALDAGCRVVVAGTGRLDSQLHQKFGADPRVVFLGHTSDVASLYREADVHVFASNGIGEGFPTVLLEAAACGIPTVGASDSGFVSEIVQAGGQCAGPSPDSFAHAVRQCLMNYEERSEQSRAWALMRSPDTFVAAYQRVLFPDETAEF